MTKHVEFARLERDWGIVVLAQDYLPLEYKRNYQVALDAQPALAVGPGSSGVPALFTTYVDPEVIRVLQAPNKGADILGERKEGDWTTQTAMFLVVENTGEVSSYGDQNNNGMSDANATYPQRQSYLFQTIIEYGDLEQARMATAKLNWVSEKQISSASTLSKFQDYTYHNGVLGLQCYGLLNDPALSAPLTPATKAAGGVTWITAGGVINASANEVYADIQALFNKLVGQTAGIVEATDDLTLAMAPSSAVALTSTNSFGVNVTDLLTKNFPKLKVKTSPRYATGAGNVVQLIADKFDGKDTGFCAFNEKSRDHAIVRELSAWKQKKTAGTWGAVIRYPAAISQMLGV
nr:MAG TPA: major capsid protein [Caudoviricetes sp.]